MEKTILLFPLVLAIYLTQTLQLQPVNAKGIMCRENQISATGISEKCICEEKVNENETLREMFDRITIFMKDNTDDNNLLAKKEWGGNCTVKHWDVCKMYTDGIWGWVPKSEKSPKGRYNATRGLINCTRESEEKKLCFKMLNNKTMTISRCHLLCMSICNRALRDSRTYVNLFSDGECVIEGLESESFSTYSQDKKFSPSSYVQALQETDQKYNSVSTQSTNSLQNLSILFIWVVFHRKY